MDTERWNAAEERRLRKLQQIRQLLSIALGPDVDLDQEAKNVIEQWEENVEMEDPPRHPRTPLQQLLANITKYARTYSTLKTRIGPARSEPRGSRQRMR